MDISDNETSLTDDLHAAFDSIDEPTDTPVDTPEEVPEEIPTDVPTDTPIDTPVEEVKKLDAPEHWAQADRELFAGQPVEVQEYLLNRHKAMEGDYTRKMQEIAPLREYQAVHDMFSPHMAALKAQGITPAQMIQQWSNVAQRLQANPKQALTELAQQYGVQLGEEAETYSDPRVAQLEQQISTLQQNIQQQQYAQQEAKKNTLLQQIEEFSTSKNDAGELNHPYFNDVVSELVTLAQAERNAGREPDLKSLYEQAVWMNPQVREALTESQRKADEKKRLDEARQKAADAKKASKRTKGSPSGESPAPELDLREMIATQFN